MKIIKNIILLFCFLQCSACLFKTIVVHADIKQSFKIGVILPLSGNLSGNGQAVRNGILLAGQENPECFSMIKFLWEDDQFDINKSITAFRKLQNMEQIDLLFLFGIPATNVLGSIIESKKVPTVAFTFISKPTVNKKFIISSLNDSPDYIKALLGNLRERGIKHFSIIKSENDFFEIMTNTFKDQLLNDEKIDIEEAVSSGETDFRTMIAKMKTRKISSLGLFLAPAQLDAFSKQLAEQKISVPIFGTDLFESAVSELGSKELEGAVYPDNEASDEFHAKYFNAYNNISHITFAANGYDMATMVGSFVCSMHSRENEIISGLDILNLLKKIGTNSKPRQSVLGRTAFVSDSSGNHFSYPVVVKRIINGGWRKVEGN